MFTYKTTIRLHHTDAAGLLFFANQFTLLHEAYESFLESIGLGFDHMLKSNDFFLPIVHASSDYKKPLFVGDKISIQIQIAHIGETSFSFEYEMKNQTDEIVGSGKTVHVTIDKDKHEKISIPNEMRKHLEQLKNV